MNGVTFVGGAREEEESMRVLITGVTTPTGRAVARMLAAAGHDVVGADRVRHRYVDPRIEVHIADAGSAGAYRGIVDGCDVVLDVSDGPVAAVAAAAQEAGARLVVLASPEREDLARTAIAATGARALLVRPASVAGRRTEGSRPVVRTLLNAGGSQRIPLVHTDDVERFLVLAATSDRTGVVDLVAPELVSGSQARAMLRKAGLRIPPRVPRSGGVRLPDLDPAAAQGDGDFRYGWTGPEVVEDIARGLVGRRPHGTGFRARRGAIPLTDYVIPARAKTSDGHPLEVAAPEGLEGEFDDRVDPRIPVHTATNTSEALPGPMSPLTIDLQAGAIRLANAAMGHMIALDGIALEHWTSRVTSVLGHHIFINASIGVLAADNMPGWDEDSIRRDVYGAIPPEVQLQPQGRPPMPTGLGSTWGTAKATGRVLATALRFRTTTETINAASHREALSRTDIEKLSDAQLHARALLWRDRLNQSWAAASIGVMLVGAATAMHARGKDDPDVPIDVNRLESARPMLAVERLAAVCREEPAVHEAARAGDVALARSRSARFAQALDAELAVVGHRGPGECEFLNPTFGDRPELLVTAAARAAELPAPKRDAVPEPTARTARMAVGATVSRERVRDAVVRYTNCLRMAARELAARLVDRHELNNVDDAWFLTLDELLWAPADLKDRVARRREERVRLQAVRMPDLVVGRWEPQPMSGALAVGDSLTGTGVSAGVVEGTVKLVLSSDDDIEPGDILIASVTDTGHTAMFAYAAAVVTDIGGSASHAAIVAREFGIPCVVDTKTASTGLSDGQRVRVDGAAGTVTLLADAQA
ncbi:PEP-utilizing enzyme [Nocardia sp. BSTN01]|uniref:PEP-utilizing enzyme n=1 Tax=Nocardia sp. BSTN01 TaxID=2783665 RepID=UPI0028156F74|nr:PEP-utilizing enzyme [Nocardia sp. BSTN01]